MLHTHDSTAHPPISKDWDGFDWVKAQYNKKNVDALEAYRELSKSTGGPTAKYGLRINAELRTAGKMSLAGRVLLVSAKTGLHSFEVAEDPSSRISEAVKAAHHFLIDDSNRNEEGHLMVSGYEFPGYRNYTALYDDQSAILQKARTTMAFKRADVHAMLLGIPGLAELLYCVLHELAIPGTEEHRLPAPQVLRSDSFMRMMKAYLKCMHFLRDDAQGQASFTYHDDVGDLTTVAGVTADLLTAVVQVSSTRTAMRMYGFEPAVFDKMGSAKIFRGGAVHQSCPRLDRSEQAVKVVFFLDKPTGARHCLEEEVPGEREAAGMLLMMAKRSPSSSDDTAENERLDLNARGDFIGRVMK